MRTFKVISPNGNEILVKADMLICEDNNSVLVNQDSENSTHDIIATFPLNFAIIEVQEKNRV